MTLEVSCYTRFATQGETKCNDCLGASKETNIKIWVLILHDPYIEIILGCEEHNSLESLHAKIVERLKEL